MIHGCEYQMDRERLKHDPDYKKRCQVELFIIAVRNGYFTDGCLIQYTETDMGVCSPTLRLDIKSREPSQTLIPGVD